MTKKEYAGWVAGFATLRPKDIRKVSIYHFRVFPEYFTKVLGIEVPQYLHVERLIAFTDTALQVKLYWHDRPLTIPRKYIQAADIRGFIKAPVK